MTREVLVASVAPGESNAQEKESCHARGVLQDPIQSERRIRLRTKDNVNSDSRERTAGAMPFGRVISSATPPVLPGRAGRSGRCRVLPMRWQPRDIYVHAEKDGDNVVNVRVGGNAVGVLDGEVHLQRDAARRLAAIVRRSSPSSSLVADAGLDAAECPV
jgi:hypothetical protein